MAAPPFSTDITKIHDLDHNYRFPDGEDAVAVEDRGDQETPLLDVSRAMIDERLKELQENDIGWMECR